MTSIVAVAPNSRPQAVEHWENEGGRVPAPKRAPPRSGARPGKRQEDTAVGCRAKAAADLVRAEELGADRMRWRMEHSAAAWTARAKTLEMIERKGDARRRAAAEQSGE